jgi:hypothetical protein
MSGPINLFWYSSVAVQLLFCIHLLWTRLAKNYPIFTLYLGCSVLGSLLAMFFMRGASGARLPLSYTYFWLWTEPILLLLQIAVALEVHARLWAKHASMVRPAQPLLFFSLLSALVFAAIPLKAELSRFSTIRLQAIMQFEFLAKRYLSTVLAIFLILSAILFVIVIHNSARSSLFRHEGMLAAYFGIYAIAFFSINMGWAMASIVNNYLASALTLCFVIWMSVFKPREEPQARKIG